MPERLREIDTYVVVGGPYVSVKEEAFAGLCLGCEIFRLGMRAGLVPETVCLECADIWSRGRANA